MSTHAIQRKRSADLISSTSDHNDHNDQNNHHDNDENTKPTPLLTQGRSNRTLDVTEYSEDERKLSNFVRLHPMLNTESLNRDTLQQLSNMVERVPIRVNTVPIVPKSYEDRFLRPAKAGKSEANCK